MGKKIEKTKEQIKPLIDTLDDIKSKTKAAKKSDTLNIKFKLDDDAVLPKYAHYGDVGMDITATGVEYLEDRDAYLYHTGLRCESEIGVGCYLLPRSSNTKTDSYLPNSIGLIDTFLYRGEMCFIFKNRTDIEVLSMAAALIRIDEMPFWKKPFANFRKIWEEEANKIRKTALDFAPYKVGDRIGQMVFFRHPLVEIEQVDELSETVRGEGGFGSTGK